MVRAGRQEDKNKKETRGLGEGSPEAPEYKTASVFWQGWLSPERQGKAAGQGGFGRFPGSSVSRFTVPADEYPGLRLE